MENIKTASKIYTITITLLVGLLLLLLYFIVLPQLAETFRESPEIQMAKIEDRIQSGIIGYFVFALIINFFAWKIESKTKKEEIRIQTLLRINSGDLASREKLKKVHKQKQTYFALIELVLLIGVGLVAGLMAITIVQPLYSLTASP